MTSRCFFGGLWSAGTVAGKVRWRTFRPLVLARFACLPRGGLEPEVHAAASCRWALMGTSGRRAAKGREAGVPPSGTAISVSPDVEEHLIRYGLDVPRISLRFPRLKKYSLERVKQVTSFLEDELRVDVRRVVTSRPDVLGASPAAIAQRVNFLQSRKVDVVAVANAFPSVLQHSVATLQRKFDAIDSLGTDAAQMINQQPMVLRIGPSKLAAANNTLGHNPSSSIPETGQASGAVLSAQAHFLKSFGLDSSEVLSKWPQLRCTPIECMQAVVDYLLKEGVDVKKVLKHEHQILCYRLPVVQEKISFLRDSGLNVVKHISYNPHVLHYSVNQKLQPTLNFVLNDMQRSRRDVDMFPGLWCFSLKHRIRPRFFYLKSLGKEDCPLNRMLFYGDQKFTELVAGHDTVHFQMWKSEHFPLAS
eukprot:EG_transcript_13456